MALSALNNRVTALEPAPSQDWGEYLDTLEDTELERLEEIIGKLPPPIEGADMSDAQLTAHFSVLDNEDLAWFDQIVTRKLGVCAV